MKRRKYRPWLAAWLALTMLGAQVLSPLAAQAETRSERTPMASRSNRQGRYQDLLARLPCPAEGELVGDYYIFGASEDPEGQYCNQKVPVKGYWVYVFPNWYIWGKEDLEAVGLSLVSRTFQLSKQRLTLEMAYYQPHRAWAETTLEQAGEALKDLEAYSGKPYPGPPVYRIEEDRELDKEDLIGRASARLMSLAPPSKSSSWTLMHEAVHIWNAKTEQDWVCEGLADVVGWFLMKENKFPFKPEQALESYLSPWHKLMGSQRDGPLPETYSKLPDGKAIHFWLMIYELYGPELLREIFIASLDDPAFSVYDLSRMLKKADSKDPSPLFSGWLRQGPYRVRKASDFGPIRYPLPDSLQL